MPSLVAEGSTQGLEHGLHDEYHSGEQGQEPKGAGSSGASGRSEGWGSGGELVSMSDLQFSRIVGEVGCSLFHAIICQRTLQ